MVPAVAPGQYYPKKISSGKVETRYGVPATAWYKNPVPLDLNEALTSLTNLVREELRLMTTWEDQIGWAHPNATIRDEIFLLAGCSMPAILRRFPGNKGAYVVVGHAYVDKIMDNKIWDQLDHQKLKYIEIC